MSFIRSTGSSVLFLYFCNRDWIPISSYVAMRCPVMSVPGSSMAVSIVVVAYVWSTPDIEDSTSINAEKTVARTIYIPRLELVLLLDKGSHEPEKYLTQIIRILLI